MTNEARTSITTSTPHKGLRIGLWVAQGLLAAVFLMAGGNKMLAPMEQLQAQMPWFQGPMGGAARFIGAMELLGALGLILPAATRIQPKLTPLAASGLATIMALASVLHVSRGEYPMIVANMVLGGLAAFIAWGRFNVDLEGASSRVASSSRSADSGEPVLDAAGPRLRAASARVGANPAPDVTARS